MPKKKDETTSENGGDVVELTRLTPPFSLDAKQEEAGAVGGNAPTLPDMLTVTLDRSYLWNDGGKIADEKYGPGEVEIPYAMAEGLVRAKALNADVLPAPLAETDTPAAQKQSDFDAQGLSEKLDAVLLGIDELKALLQKPDADSADTGA